MHFPKQFTVGVLSYERRAGHTGWPRPWTQVRLCVRVLSSGRAGQPCVLFLSFSCPPLVVLLSSSCPSLVLWPRWPTLCPPRPPVVLCRAVLVSCPALVLPSEVAQELGRQDMAETLLKREPLHAPRHQSLSRSCPGWSCSPSSPLFPGLIPCLATAARYVL